MHYKSNNFNFTEVTDNISFIFKLDNPAQTHESFAPLLEYMALVDGSPNRERFEQDHWDAVRTTQNMALHMCKELDNKGELGFLLHGSMINLGFMDEINLNHLHILYSLRGCRDLLTEFLTPERVKLYKFGQKVLSDWIFFIENL